MTVRRHVPWPARLAALALAAVLGAGLAGVAFWWLHPALDGLLTQRRQLNDEMKSLGERLAQESAERSRLEGLASAADSQALVDRAASEQLAQQLKRLEAENAELKSDLAYLESLLQDGGEAKGPIAIRRFEVEPDQASRQMRYRALLTQNGHEVRQFSGSLQLLLTVAGNGRTKTLLLPDEGPTDARERMKVSFRRHLRVEGYFPVPAGEVLKSVQLRVLEGGTLRAQQTAMP
ncbi:MAG: hypothetical protein ABT05_01810 [Lautropia sp. SCN 66-9]|nr:MAG: hypothetical protein ABT05_01810 [Lautropia sp. SCN 66-9]